MVVNELINESNVNVTVKVKALVRDLDKAAEVLPKSPLIEIIKCDLNNDNEAKEACNGGDAMIWYYY